MEKKQDFETTNTPVLYALDPDAALKWIYQRMREDGLVLKDRPDHALTIAQAAKRLNFTTDHIRRLVDLGFLPATNYASPGSSRAEWRIFESDLKNVNR